MTVLSQHRSEAGAEKALRRARKAHPNAYVIHEPATRVTNERWLIVVDDASHTPNQGPARALLVTELPEEGEIAPGYYLARASDQAYGILLAMATAGDAQLLGDRYDPSGEKIGAFAIGQMQANQERPQAAADTLGYLFDVVETPGMRPNQAEKRQIRIGQAFFTSALRDYAHNWRERWWREAIQNAVDAGAREVSCEIQQQADGSWLVSCQDDGSGMDEDVLLNKFLVLGGTTKVVGGTTGGFGKAKELLVLPWMSWEIHTRDTIVRGSGIEYEVEKSEHLSGTRLSVLMPADNATAPSDALGFIKKCDLPRLTFSVNGERAYADLRAGDVVKNFDDKAELSYAEANTNFPYYMLVRTNGLYMFEEYVHNKPKGLLVLELLRPSIELLTANRDGFADHALRRDVSGFAGKLAVEQEVALRTAEKRIRQKFRGTGKFEIETHMVEAAVYETLGRLEPSGRKEQRGEVQLSDEQLREIVRRFREQPPPATEVIYTDERGRPIGEERALDMRVDPEVAAAMLAGLSMSGPTQVEVAVRQLAWEPDFYVVNEIAGFGVPKKFFPESMTAPIRTLARYWAELCRFVLIQLGSSHRFGVGFVFDRSVVAEYVAEESEHWLMLNPFDNQDPETGTIYTLSRDDHLAEIYASAVHECTHMADRVSEHGLDFARALTKNIAKTYGKDKQIRAIKRSVLALERQRPRKARVKKPKAERPSKPFEESIGWFEEGEPLKGWKARRYGSAYYAFATLGPSGQIFLDLAHEAPGGGVTIKRYHWPDDVAEFFDLADHWIGWDEVSIALDLGTRAYPEPEAAVMRARSTNRANQVEVLLAILSDNPNQRIHHHPLAVETVYDAWTRWVDRYYEPDPRWADYVYR